MKRNYNKSIIYIIKSNDLYYVGATTQSLESRLKTLRHYNFYSLREYDSLKRLLCCVCSKHYCFYCTDAWVFYGDELMKFSSKSEPIESIEFGYNNPRNIKKFVNKFYCEHCLK